MISYRISHAFLGGGFASPPDPVNMSTINRATGLHVTRVNNINNEISVPLDAWIAGTQT